jgi:hypothetical protein
MTHADTSQHFLYLSLSAWSEARRRAVVEGTSASRMLNRLFAAYLQQPLPDPLPTRRPRAGGTLEFFERRSLHLEKSTWAAIQARGEAEQRSVSAIAEQLLRQYLGLELPD